MKWARRPCCVDESIMKVLLNIVNDIADIVRRIAGKQSATCGHFDDRFFMSGADGRVDVRAKLRNGASLILGGYSARCLALLAPYRTRLTGRHALLHDKVIAAEEAAAQNAHAPASLGRFAATCPTFEWERDGKHRLSLCGTSPESSWRRPFSSAAEYQRSASTTLAHACARSTTTLNSAATSSARASAAVNPKAVAYRLNQLLGHHWLGEHALNGSITEFVRCPGHDHDRNVARLNVGREIVANLNAAELR